MTACNRFWNGLAALASGETDPETQMHMETCADCQAKLTELTQAVQAMKRPEYDAPRDQVLMAASLMPVQQRRRFLASLLSSSLAAAGARSAVAESFQMTFQHDDLTTRVMVSKVDRGWEVMTRIPEQWLATTLDGDVQSDAEGRFSFVAPDLDQTGFILRRGDVEVQIPSAREAMPGGTE
ncbi:MAG: hypothetical protein K1X67_17720 [Fimbriimonadaceae bacterium]|nr:hypothetical protein [Fimbriimonadaceae bacterium]